MGGFEYRHTVTFEETNVVGNVYFTNYFLWQGRCREMFLRTYCPELMESLKAGSMGMATLESSCTYRSELFADNDVIIEMFLERTTASRMWVTFDYLRLPGRELVAQGRQVIGCVAPAQEGAPPTPCQIPDALLRAMEKHQRAA